jgi:SAM-dependent methyltransferase
MAEPTLTPHARDWEELAELDPLWAIASTPGKRFGGWERDEFFAAGERMVADSMARIDELGIEVPRGSALDFGCGVGRTARALADRFAQVVGVDIAPTMVERGRELNADVANLEFLVNSPDGLDVLGERRFDLIYTRVVLQHQPTRDAARACIQELVARLEPDGLAVFHIPVHIPLRYRLLVARRAYKVLRRLGVPAQTLYTRLKLHPISMLFVPREQVEQWVAAAGGRVVDVDGSVSPQGIESATFYAKRA